jgi:hypothetical protein
MVMRYFGGGIGHLKNTPLQQVPIDPSSDPSSEDMAVDEEDDDIPHTSENEDLGTIDDMIISDELEDHEDDHGINSDDDSDEGEEQTVEDEDSGCSDDDEDYGYATL